MIPCIKDKVIRMSLQNRSSFEIAKKFYEQLDSSQIENLTKER